MARKQTSAFRQSEFASDLFTRSPRAQSSFAQVAKQIVPTPSAPGATSPALSFSEMQSLPSLEDTIPSYEVSGSNRGVNIYKTLYEASLPKRPTPVPIMWENDVEELISEVIDEAKGDECPVVVDDVISCTTDLLYALSDNYTREPSLTHDDKGGIEIFLKNEHRGLLIKIQSDGFVWIFGDYGDEQWRNRYQLGGSAWKHHIACIINGLTK